MSTELRRIFDTIPEQFDKHRRRYCPELFDRLIRTTGLDESKTVLEIGPGTGQASQPILHTGCDYHAIELGEHLAAKMSEKFGHLPNFHMVVDDFITHDFGTQQFDVILSAATIQWIPEEIAFQKTFRLLKPGGFLVMITAGGDYRSPNEELYQKIQQVYSAHFKPTVEYPHRGFRYRAATEYGYEDFQHLKFQTEKVFTADEYVAFTGTHCDHLVLPEEHRDAFFHGLRQAILDAGDRLVSPETHSLMIARKPL